MQARDTEKRRAHATGVNSTMRRKFLATVTFLIGLAGLAFACTPFIGSLQPNAKAKANEALAPKVIKLSQLKIGKPLVTEIRGWPLIVLKPSEEQKQSISELDEYVADPEIKSYFKEHDLYIYWGAGKKGKYYCLAKHQSYPRNEEHKWKGGYYTIPCDISYDYAGRAIQNREYSYLNYGGVYENFEVPSKVNISDNELRVSR